MVYHVLTLGSSNSFSRLQDITGQSFVTKPTNQHVLQIRGRGQWAVLH